MTTNKLLFSLNVFNNAIYAISENFSLIAEAKKLLGDYNMNQVTVRVSLRGRDPEVVFKEIELVLKNSGIDVGLEEK